MNNCGKLINPTTLQFERMLPGPIERIWQYLTDGDKRALWFAGGPTDLNLGGEMELVFHNSQFSTPPDPTPQKYEAFGDGFVSKAKVVTCQPPNLLVIEWEGRVTFQLTAVGEEVRLILTHEKLNDDPETRIGTLAGWHTHLDILMDRLSLRAPKGFWKVHMDLEAQYGVLLNEG